MRLSNRTIGKVIGNTPRHVENMYVAGDNVNKAPVLPPYPYHLHKFIYFNDEKYNIQNKYSQLDHANPFYLELFDFENRSYFERKYHLFFYRKSVYKYGDFVISIPIHLNISPIFNGPV